MENKYTPYGNSEVKESVFSSLLFKSFLFFGIELLLTGLLTFGFSYLFDSIFPIYETNNMIFYIVLLVISSIGLLITSFVSTKLTLTNSKGGIISVFFYVLFMSILLSSLSFYIGFKEVAGMAVLITACLFFIMAIFGILIKKRIGWLIGLACGLAISAGIIYLINTFLLFPIMFGNTSLIGSVVTNIYIGEWIILIYASVITIIDVFKIKKYSQNGETSSSIALYFSLNLYSDFILILLKVMSILLRSRSNNN